MKKLLSVLVIALLIVAVGFQFWLKPDIEKDLAQALTANMKLNGMTLKEPLKVSVSPLSRTLTIDPFTADIHNEFANNGTLKAQKTTLELTLNGLLSTTDLASLVLPKSGALQVFTQADIDAVDVSTDLAKIHMESLSVKNATMDLPDFHKLLEGKLADPTEVLSFEEIFTPKTTIQVLDQQSDITIGNIIIEGYTPKFVAKVTLQNFDLKSPDLDLSFKESIKTNVRLLTDAETLAITQKLLNATKNKEQALDAVLPLIVGDNPLIGQIEFKGIAMKIPGQSLDMGGFSLINSKQGQAVSIALNDIKIAKSTIEALTSMGSLNLPENIFLSVNSTYSQESKNLANIKFNFDIKDLLNVDITTNAQAASLENTLLKYEQLKMQDLALVIADQTLFARLVTKFAQPNQNPKDFVFQQMALSPNASKTEVDLTQKMKHFVEKPGKIIMKSRPNVTFHLSDLDTENLEALTKIVTFSVEPGQQTLEEQIAQVSK